MKLVVLQLLLPVAAVTLFLFLLFYRICRKAGYSGLPAACAFIPVLNFALLVVLAFSRWPIEDELERARLSTSEGR